jgi:signal recognition particle subunit SRP54
MGGVKIPKEMLETQQGKLENWKHIMNSMTKEELEDPDEVMSAARVHRIAKGSGMPVEEVRALLKQYKQSKKVMKAMKGDGKKMEKMMKKFQKGGMPKGFKF